LIEASLSDATGELQGLLENAAEITTRFTASSPTTGAWV